MNKLTCSIEFSFDVDAGTIELLDDDKLCTYRPIHPEVFFERYSNYKMDLKGKTYIDSTAQQVLKIAESVIKNVIEENDGCVRVTTTGDVGRYVDALKEPLNDILYPLFENHTAVMSDDAGTNDIIVFKNGCVWVSRHFRAYVVGQNPKLSKEELNKKIEQELLKHFDKEVAGISPEFIYTTVVPGLDVR